MSASYGRIAALVFVVVALVAAGTQRSHAQTYEQALAGFAADSFGDTEKAITGVAGSGNPLAAQVIEALQDGRLLFNADTKKVYIRDKAGKIARRGDGCRGGGRAAPPTSSRCA